MPSGDIVKPSPGDTPTIHILVWDKGKAVLWLLQALDLDKTAVLPLYLEGDITDEDALKVLKDFGIGIVIGEDSRLTITRYALKTPDDVQDFLQSLIPVLRSKSP